MPYRPFLIMVGFGLTLLAVSWLTYDPDTLHGYFLLWELGTPDFSDISYVLFAFCWICAWGYLIMKRWRIRPPSAITGAVLVLLMFELATILVGFSYPIYECSLDTIAGRLDAAASGLEYLLLTLGFGCVLLGETRIMTVALFATALPVAGDIAYAVTDPPPAIEPVWMLAPCMLLGTLIAIAESLQRHAAKSAEPGAGAWSRSGLSRLFILLALGGMMLSVAIWLVPVNEIWKAFFAVLFIVALVAALIWATDRFDETVRFVGSYAARLHRRRLEADDWRDADAYIRTMLKSTGLNAVLVGLRDSAARLRQDLLFLGPERLFPMPRSSGEHFSPYFLIMPFNLE